MQRSHDGLVNQYQFRASISREVLIEMQAHLQRPASALKKLGDLERRLGRPDQARELYDRALVLYEGEQDWLAQANTLLALGDAQRHAGQYGEATGFYQRALTLFAQEQEPMGIACTFAELARCPHALGDKSGCNSALQSALEAAKKSNVDSVSNYVTNVLEEITGGPEQAIAWLGQREAPDA